MAKINRYTQYQPSRYKAQSLQDLMVAPQYMRAQHNQLENSIAEAETALAQVDNLDIHDPVVKAKQEELNKRLEEQVGALSSEGFNSSNRSNFLRFNKDYQQAMGPKGEFGRAQAAKEALAKERDSYIANATKMGYDPQAVASNWDKHYQTYKDSFDGKNISNIGAMYSPEFVDYKQEFTDLLAKAGVSSTDIANIGSNIVPNEDGSYVLNSKFREKYANNLDQIQAAENYINNQINNPNSKVRKSMEHNGISEEQAIAEITGIKDVYKQDQYAKETGNSITGYKPPAKAEGMGSPESGLTYAATQTIPQEFHEMEYSEMGEQLNALKTLVSSGDATPEDVVRLEKIEDFYGRVQAKLTDNPSYNEKLKRKQEYEDQLNAIKSGTYDWSNRFDYDEMESNDEYARRAKDDVQQQFINKINSLDGELNDIGDEEKWQHQMEVSEFNLTPSQKNQKVLDQLNNNVRSVLGSNVNSLFQAGDLLMFDKGDGLNRSLTNDVDKKGISKLVHDAINNENSDVKINSVVMEGASGKPEIVFSIPTKDVEYNMEGTWLNSKGNDYTGDIGGGETLKVRLAFNKNFDKSGIKDLNGLIQQYMAQSSPEGARFVKAQETSRFYANNTGKTWSDVKDQLSNPMVAQIWSEKLKQLGVTQDTSDEELQNKINQLLNNKISK